MDPEESNSIRVQRYLDGDMSADERAEFEKELPQDPALRRLTATYQGLATGIRHHARLEAWEKIQQLEETHADDTIVVADSRRNTWLYAATVSILLLAFGSLYLFNIGGNTAEVLFEEHFTPYPVLAHAPVRSVETAVTLEERAFSAYSNEDYAQAVALLEKINEGEEDPLIMFYLGNAYLSAGEVEKAIPLFEKVLQRQTALSPQAQWYLGLGYLARGDREGARGVFEALAADTSSYGTKAKTILHQL